MGLDYSRVRFRRDCFDGRLDLELGVLRAEILKRWPDAVLPDGPPVTNIFSAVDKAVRKWAPAALRAQGLEEHAAWAAEADTWRAAATATARAADRAAARATWAAHWATWAAHWAAYRAADWAASGVAHWVIQAAPSLEAAVELLEEMTNEKNRTV
jgi:hypothetical protein